MNRPFSPERGESLAERLSRYADSDFCPMHMPGHKRRTDADPRLPWRMDVTEIHGFDNLHEPEEILLRMQETAARLFGSSRAFLMVNGSTGGILASVSACTQPGDHILVARNCHKSVYHAIELGSLTPHYLLPETDPRFPFCGSVSPEAVASALKACPSARAAVITSPTYEGILSDIPAIAEICHAHGIPLIVDSAHGAHLGFHPFFPENAVRQGADIVVQSLHKTLPALTQTAVLHVSGALVAPEEIAHQLDIFETSSPSYILMASMDACLRFLSEEGEARFAAYAQRIRRFESACAPLRRLVPVSALLKKGAPFCADVDPGKLTILTAGVNITGHELMARLREEAQIECEMALKEEILAMTSVLDPDENFDRLSAALLAIDRTLSPSPVSAAPSVPTRVPRRVLPIREAVRAPRKSLPWREAEGCIAADYFWVYPPGIPYVTPGEEIDAALISAIPDPDASVSVLIRS